MESSTTLIVLVSILALIGISIFIGIYMGKKRAKTAMPDKETEIE